MKSVTKYVVFRQKAEYGWISHKDLYRRQDVMLDKSLKNPVLSFLNNIHTSAKANKYFELPFQSVWYNCYLDENKLNPSDKIIFMFEDGSRNAFNPGYIHYLRSKYKNGYFVFAAFNSSFRYPKRRLDIIESTYDLVTSFDRKDCKERGWFLYTGVYSTLDHMRPAGHYDSDVYFAGADKGRLPIIYEIYERLTRAGLRCDFTVTGVKEADIDKCTGIKFNEWTKYEDVVRKVCSTRCLLDIIQPGQDGETYRQGEAVAYGIKLITNYQNIVLERYYNPKQMRIIKNAEDIDIDFITNSYTSADFPYNGCLDPYLRLEALNQYFQEIKTR